MKTPQPLVVFNRTAIGFGQDYRETQVRQTEMNIPKTCKTFINEPSTHNFLTQVQQAHATCLMYYCLTKSPEAKNGWRPRNKINGQPARIFLRLFSERTTQKHFFSYKQNVG